MISNSIPQTLNKQIIEKKPYDYTFKIGMGYRLTSVNYTGFLDLPKNKSYGDIKYAVFKAYQYFDPTTTGGEEYTHIHIGENQVYISGGSTDMPVGIKNNVDVIINYGVFNGNQLQIIVNIAANYRLDLFIDFYY